VSGHCILIPGTMGDALLRVSCRPAKVVGYSAHSALSLQTPRALHPDPVAVAEVIQLKNQFRDSHRGELTCAEGARHEV
jgi:hypothetical protein